MKKKKKKEKEKIYNLRAENEIENIDEEKNLDSTQLRILRGRWRDGREYLSCSRGGPTVNGGNPLVAYNVPLPRVKKNDRIKRVVRQREN